MDCHRARSDALLSWRPELRLAPDAAPYYISLQPHGQSMVAGGLYDPTPEQLDRFRQVIDRDAAAFRRVVQAPDFVAVFGAVEGARLKTAPKGYDRDHPAIDLPQLKQILAMRRFQDEEVLTPDFAGRAVAACWAMRPFPFHRTDVWQGHDRAAGAGMRRRKLPVQADRAAEGVAHTAKVGGDGESGGGSWGVGRGGAATFIPTFKNTTC